jgi:type 1 fimbria pilin
MVNLQRYLMLLPFVLSPAALAITPLGEINIELRGNVVDFTCAVEAADSNKTVALGTWPTKQLRTAGSTTQPVPFTLHLVDCPPGSASITFSGAPATDNALLALSDSEMAKKVAIELRDSDRKRLPLQSASPPVPIDDEGMRRSIFMPITSPLPIPPAGSGERRGNLYDQLLLTAVA